MNSLNTSVEALHRAYLEATCRELPMTFDRERMWLDAHNAGMTPDDVKLVIKRRLKGVATGERRENSTLIRNICGSAAIIDDTMEEAEAIKSKMRLRVFDKDKSSVLRATGRADSPSQQEAKSVAALPLIEQLRKAAG